MKLLVVDDQAMVRQGIVALLTQADPSTVVLEAGDSAQGLAIANEQEGLDAIFLDLALPGMGGMAAIVEFGRQRPDVPIIVLTASDDPQKVRQAFELGALGYVPKSASGQTLLAALRLVLSGEAFVPTLMLRDGPAVSGPAPRRGGVRLTARQSEILDCLRLGLSNKEIGLRLGLSEKTVKAHVTGVLRGLGAATRAEAVKLARQSGLV
jgi:DNA-binding NarL/FixJ family response regulator